MHEDPINPIEECGAVGGGLAGQEFSGRQRRCSDVILGATNEEKRLERDE
jgi:hypothetical protein